jgi:hypothetical protein
VNELVIFDSDMKPIAFFNPEHAVRNWAAKENEGAYSSHLFLLPSGRWVVRKTQLADSRTFAFPSGPARSALWLIRHGYVDDAYEYFPDECSRLDWGREATDDGESSEMHV